MNKTPRSKTKSKYQKVIHVSSTKTFFKFLMNTGRIVKKKEDLIKQFKPGRGSRNFVFRKKIFVKMKHSRNM